MAVMQTRFALTTVDNPFNPFKDFKSWFLFDIEKGYNSCSYLGRIARTSDMLSDEEKNREVERAIDEIIRLDFTNRYVKVSEDYPVSENFDDRILL